MGMALTAGDLKRQEKVTFSSLRPTVGVLTKLLSRYSPLNVKHFVTKFDFTTVTSTSLYLPKSYIKCPSQLSSTTT